MKFLNLKDYGIIEISSEESCTVDGGFFNSLTGEYSLFRVGTYLGNNFTSFFKNIEKGIVDKVAELSSNSN